MFSAWKNFFSETGSTTKVALYLFVLLGIGSLIFPDVSLVRLQSTGSIPDNRNESPTPQPAVQDPLMDERTKGDPQAPITIYEITDFACPWCRVFWEQTLPDIDAEYIQTGKAKLVFVNLPIPQLHPNAPAAHEFAMCSAKQDRFWPIHDLLYRYQEDWAHLEDPKDYFISLADSANVNVDSLTSCLDDGSTRWLVQQESESVVQNGITSTPSFVMDSLLLGGFQPIEGWRPILDSLFVAKTGGGLLEN